MKKILLTVFSGVLGATPTMAFTPLENAPEENNAFLKIRHGGHGHHRAHNRGHHRGHHHHRHWRGGGYGPALTWDRWCVLSPDGRYRTSCSPYLNVVPVVPVPVVPVVPPRGVIILNSFNQEMISGLYHPVSEQNPFTDHTPGGTTNVPRAPMPIDRSGADA